MASKEIKVSLPGVERPAIIVLTRAGQTPPDEGDNVRVRWQLQLPAGGQVNYLHSECRFGGRVKPVCGHSLTQDWGEEVLHRSAYIARSGYTSASTWDEAFRAAKDYVLGQLEPLLTALRARQRALETADRTADDEDYVIGALNQLIEDLRARKQAREEAD